jgi:redox-sensitive bicupin YhaK (pirin superfamily)
LSTSRRLFLQSAGIILLGCTKKSALDTSRQVTEVINAQATRDGAGVNLHRALGGKALSMLDPFLLLDEFRSDNPDDYLAGFPSHPHRGFETVTYMLEGAMEHKDNVGNQGRLRPGSAQWMTAGHGIVHSEMPKQERGLMWGYQLWVNLPAVKKMIKPRYQDISPDRIPEIEQNGVKVRVVAGESLGQTGPVSGIEVEPLFLDLALAKGADFWQTLAPRHNAFVFVIQGALDIGGNRQEVSEGQLAVLSPGAYFEAHCTSNGGRALLFAGRPLGEPVSRKGPFVMNTDDEIKQAFDDYRSGRLTEGG